MINIGVAGSPNHSRKYTDTLLNLTSFNLTGLFTGMQNSENNPCSKNKKFVYSYDELIYSSDAILISGIDNHFFQYAAKAIKHAKHVFITSLVDHTLEEANQLMKLADEADVILQIGKTERFNPAFLAAYPYINTPNYIEINKSVPPGECLSNHSLVMNNLTELLDIVFFTVKSNLMRVHTAGTPVYNHTNDIVNIRLEFDNTRVANITINRVDGTHGLSSTFYQKKSIVRVDHVTQNATVSKHYQERKNPVVKEQILIVPNNPLEVELLNFHRNVTNHRNSIMFTGDDYKNLFAAHQVLERLKRITASVE